MTDGSCLEAIRREPDLCDMPLVLCTSPSQNLAEHDDLLRRLRVALVPKPFDIDYLLDVIEELLPLSERDESGSVDTTGT